MTVPGKEDPANSVPAAAVIRRDLALFGITGRKALSPVMIMTVAGKETPANSVPAAAVIRRGLALFGITGRKARVGGLESWG